MKKSTDREENRNIQYTQDTGTHEGNEEQQCRPDSKFRYHVIGIGLVVFITCVALMGIYYVMFHSEKLSNVYNFLAGIFKPVFYGFVIAYLMTPILNWMERSVVKPCLQKAGLKWRTRGISVLLTAVLTLLALFLIIYLFVSQIIPSINDIIEDINIYSENIQEFFDTTFEDYPEIEEQVTNLYDFIYSQTENFSNTIMDNLSSVLLTVFAGGLSVLNTLWNFILGFIFALYMIGSKEMFVGQARKIVYCLFSEDTANQILADAKYTHKTYIGFIGGKVLDSFIIGCLCLLFTSILGTPYNGLVSLIVGVTNIIPFFGPFIGGIPCAVLVFVVEPTHPLNMVYFGLLILLLQLFDGYVLGPRILGNSTGITGFWVIFSIIVFSGFFGVIGMVIGVPTFAVIFAAIRRVVNGRLREKGLSTERKKYETMTSMQNGKFIEAPEKEKEPKRVHHRLRDVFVNSFKSHHR
ncbi:MAG: AI-2E family transporter [Lachnospiraceae bacterium]|nr:AI-2E family transporter [Lachnospiraceae bacterium]